MTAMLAALKLLQGLNIVGADIVGRSAFDPSERTALAALLVRELLLLWS